MVVNEWSNNVYKEYFSVFPFYVLVLSTDIYSFIIYTAKIVDLWWGVLRKYIIVFLFGNCAKEKLAL